MIPETEIRQRLNGIFQEVFDDSAILIHDAMTAKDVEEWDSLTHVNLIVAVEKRFGVSFTTRDVSSIRNVGDFIKLIQKNLG